MKTIEKTITYTASQEDILGFFLNDFNEINNIGDDFIVREVKIKRGSLGGISVEIKSVEYEDN